MKSQTTQLTDSPDVRVDRITAVHTMMSAILSDEEVQLISDGYHTFNELYEFRKMYNALLFNEWAREWRSSDVTSDRPLAKYDVHKSWNHYDGDACFGGGWFIVVANLPNGQITNHYKAEDWDLFLIPEEPRAKYKYDGHTASDVIDRMRDTVKHQKWVARASNTECKQEPLPSTPDKTFGDVVIGLHKTKGLVPTNSNVAKVKTMCAEIIDMIDKCSHILEPNRAEQIIFNHAIGQVINAQMSAVKALTVYS